MFTPPHTSAARHPGSSLVSLSGPNVRGRERLGSPAVSAWQICVMCCGDKGEAWLACRTMAHGCSAVVKTPFHPSGDSQLSAQHGALCIIWHKHMKASPSKETTPEVHEVQRRGHSFITARASQNPQQSHAHPTATHCMSPQLQTHLQVNVSCDFGNKRISSLKQIPPHHQHNSAPSMLET